MSSRAPSDKIYQSTGLRVRPFVNAIGSQFMPILHTTVGVSCHYNKRWIEYLTTS